MTKLALLFAITILLFSCNISKSIRNANNSDSENKEVSPEGNKINTQSRDAQLIEMGVDFVAFGNNPSWILKIDFDKRIANLEQFGRKTVEFKLINKGDNNIEAAEYYSEYATLNIKIEETNCYDITTGEGFAYLLKGELDGEPLAGFGKYLADEIVTPSVNPIIFGKWNLTELGSTSIEGINGASIIFLASNTLGGNTGCNNYFGTYNITNNEISLSNVGSTQMYCEKNIEKEFALAQKRVTNYIINKNILMLYNKDNKLEMQFTKSTEK